jgi:hypothetical protein
MAGARQPFVIRIVWHNGLLTEEIGIPTFKFANTAKALLHHIMGRTPMRNELSRRRLLEMAGGMLAGHGAAVLGGHRAFAKHRVDRQLSDEEIIEILLEELEPRGPQFARTTIKPFWFQKEEGSRSAPRWPADNVSFDYAHLLALPNSDKPFELTADVLQRLLSANSFQRRADAPKVLFGLRGCIMAGSGDHADWGVSHQVRAVRPNHLDLRCLLGVWDTTKNTVALFKASTVPNFEFVDSQVGGGPACNMLPTGMHQYRVGAHRGESQPGAFRQQTPLWVIRTKKTPVFAANDAGIEWDDLDGDLPFDNIHAAKLDTQKKAPHFSSAGCQTIAGNYRSGVPTGAWAEFRKAAGLAHPPNFVSGSRQNTSDDGRAFEYALLTGKDAQVVTTNKSSDFRALRFGSSGDRVSELQEKLAVLPAGAGVQKSGVYDWKTLGGVLRWQKENKLAPSGLIAAQTAQMLGLTWS